MTSLGSNRTVKRWVCSVCREARISINLGDCPSCQHSRCIDCHVKSYIATEAENGGDDKKTTRCSVQSFSQDPPLPRLDTHGSSFEFGRASNETSSQLLITRARGISGCIPATPVSSSFRTVLTEELQSSFSQFRLPMFPIASGTESHSIFILREDQDQIMVSMWHAGLTELSESCHNSCSTLVSIHLFRMGIDEASSTPTVLINTSQPLGETEKRILQCIISGKLYLVSPPIQIVFRQARLRRSVEHISSSWPPICEPRNIQFSTTPGTGASIGIAGSLQDTASLGCYLQVDKKPMILTVDHLIPNLSAFDPVITHVSEQDFLDLMTPMIKDFIAEYVSSTDHSCLLCDELRHPQVSDQILRSHLIALKKETEHISCPLDKEITTIYLSNEDSVYRALPLAKKYAQSGRRFRSHDERMQSDAIFQGSREVRREMDWALFEVFEDDKFGLYNSMSQSQGLRFTTENEDHSLRPEPVKPGALIRSLGRTSGHQVGQISNTASIIYHGNYETEEWCVLSRPDTKTEDWIEEGIGVDGDSGSLIVDENCGAVYGMLWGRSGDGPTTVTLFTPMNEIFDDVLERNFTRFTSSEPSVEIIWGQDMPTPSTPSSGSEGDQMNVESVPITVRIEDRELNIVLEKAIASPQVHRQSSMETGHPHRLKRYRRHGQEAARQSVPRSMTHQNNDGKAENTRFPGSHTYLRYVLAPERE